MVKHTQTIRWQKPSVSDHFVMLTLKGLRPCETSIMKIATSETATRGGLEMFLEKDVLRNFTKFTGKHLCQSLVFNGLQLF